MSEETAIEEVTPMEDDPEDEEDEDEDEEEAEDDDEELEEDLLEEDLETEVTVGRRTGRGLTLKTLLKANVLQPGQGYMNINYLGNKFKGDLLPDGRIRSQETNKIFSTPSAWAIFCKKIVNPDKKSGCGWASVRYRGKKLDAYKNNWYRQKRLEFEREGEEIADDDTSITDSDGGGLHEHQEIVDFEVIGARHPNHDMNMMVELTSFQSLGRMQPFNVTMSSSAAAVIDVHTHLSTSEVAGYLAGQWDVNNHNLIVSHAMPILCRLGDGEKGPVVEQDIYNEMKKNNLTLVGWYHTHPFSSPLPTIRDIDTQLDYEMKMKGYNDSSYTPCIGIIVSPYQRDPIISSTPGKLTGFWVMPPPEHKPQEYGRPMELQYNIVKDAFIPKEALIHMKNCVALYKNGNDAIKLNDNFIDDITYWAKLKVSLQSRVPSAHIIPLMEFICKLLNTKLTPEEIEELTKPEPKPDPDIKPDLDVKPDIDIKPSVNTSKHSNEVKLEPMESTDAKRDTISPEGTPLPATIQTSRTVTPIHRELDSDPSKHTNEGSNADKVKVVISENSDDSDMSVPSAPQLQALAEAHLQPMEQSPSGEERHHQNTERKSIPKPPSLIQESHHHHQQQYSASSKLQSMLQDDHQANKLQSLLHDKQQATKIQSLLQEQIQASKLQSMLQDKQQASQLQTLIHEQQQASVLKNLFSDHQSSKLQNILKEQQEAINLHALIQAQQQSNSLQSFLQEQQSNALHNLIQEQQSASLQSYLQDHHSKKLQSMLLDQQKSSKYLSMLQDPHSLKSQMDAMELKSKYLASAQEPMGNKLSSMLHDKFSSYKQPIDRKSNSPIPATSSESKQSLSISLLQSSLDDGHMKKHASPYIQESRGSKSDDPLALLQKSSKINIFNPDEYRSTSELSLKALPLDISDPSNPLSYLQHRNQSNPASLYLGQSFAALAGNNQSHVSVEQIRNADELMEVDHN